MPSIEKFSGDSSSEELLASELQRINERRENLKPWKFEKRALDILTGLGLTPSDMKKNVNELSGGLQMRVSLACGMFNQPDILLLDKSTIPK